VDERYAIRVIAESLGARFDLRHVSIAEAERRARARSRWELAPETTFPVSDADHDRFLALCQPPSHAELSNRPCARPSARIRQLVPMGQSLALLPRFDPA
jgi:hypothetical protein